MLMSRPSHTDRHTHTHTHVKVEQYSAEAESAIRATHQHALITFRGTCYCPPSNHPQVIKDFKIKSSTRVHVMPSFSFHLFEGSASSGSYHLSLSLLLCYSLYFLVMFCYKKFPSQVPTIAFSIDFVLEQHKRNISQLNLIISMVTVDQLARRRSSG